MRLRIQYTLISKALAVLLLAAATLKVHGIGEGPVGTSGAFSTGTCKNVPMCANCVCIYTEAPQQPWCGCNSK
jgi:hypothetical protein